MSERPVADPIVTALRLALAEIAARRAAESSASRGKMGTDSDAKGHGCMSQSKAANR